MIRYTLPVSVLAMALAAFTSGFRFNDANPLEFYAGGQPGAPVKLEVFSDYQCPACRTFYLDTIRIILREYANERRVSVVYHDFPLAMHQYSREATRYALAAQRLGRDYWLRMTDALYEDQAKWSQDGKIDLIAVKIFTAGEYAKLKQQLQDPLINQVLEAELAVAGERKIESTPTFFLSINGHEQKVVGGVAYPILKNYLDRLLK